MGSKFQVPLNKQLQDLNPIYAGEAVLDPGHRWGPGRVNCVLIHKIIKGTGTLYARGTTQEVTAGYAFIVMPGEVAQWRASETDPWTYQWIGFTGELADKFSQLPSVFKAPEDMFRHINSSINDPDENLEYLLAGDLFHLYGALLKPQKQRLDHIQRTINYIQNFYMNDLTVQQIADHIGLNRNYLSRLFKEKTGISVQEQMMLTRLMEAKRFLSCGYSVKETADLCGFNEAANFSKLFKRQEGISPKDWKKKFPVTK